MESFAIFCAFLDAEKVSIRRLPTLEETVERNFDVLDEAVLRKLIAKALEEQKRNSDKKESLGHWAEVIEVVRYVTQKMQSRATRNIGQLMDVSKEESPAKMINFLRSMKARNEIDRLFVELIVTSLQECAKRPEDEAASNTAAMFQFALDVVQRLMTTPAAVTTSAAKNSVSSSSSSMSSSAGGGISETDSDSDAKRGGGGIGGSSATNSESESESASSSTRREAKANELMKIGTWIQGMLKSCQGETGRMLKLILAEVDSGTYDIADLLIVLQDNIEACRQMNYTNKLKVFEFLQDKLNKHFESKQEPSASSAAGDPFSTYHAPKFVDSASRGEGWKNVDINDPALNILISSPVSFIEGKCATEIKIANRKNKKEKKKKEEALGQVAESVGKHLEGHGWSVCDDFLSLDLVRRVRTEVALFTDYYEMSEIWVGKKADVGAHLSVPSVRGDKVLWMCGAHQAPEGVTRQVQTIGEVEPCKLKIKAAAPTRKFIAIRELIESTDMLVDELKEKFPQLSGIYERSDAMFAVYPGGGARFANHIDNTVGDGRILTILIYLNPDWKVEMGGALRITQPSKDTLDKYQLGKIPKKPDSSSSSSSSTSPSTASDELKPKVVNTKSESAAAEEEEPSTSKTSSSPSSSSSIPPGASASAGTNSLPPSPPEPVQLIDVFPKAGRMAVFYSSMVQHEVMPTFGDRHAITIWYYDRNERQKAIERAKDSGASMETSKTSEASQKEAKQFMSALMGNKGPTDKTRIDLPVSIEELQMLREKVRNLSSEATKIVSSITGAPSPESFKEGFEIITTDDLFQMRHLFSRMGLDNRFEV